jgi:hypothetical protein
MTEITEKPSVYLDPKAIYAEELEHWSNYWDGSLSLYQNAHNLTQQCVVLPHAAIQMPVAVTYMLIPSKWAKVLPILFSWGDKGTGKSTFAILAAKLHGQAQVFSAADTFASIRNSLDLQRWIDPEEKEYEKDGSILCWDNIHTGTLERDPKIFQMLLFGYNRASEVIQIATPDGSNRKYYVFSPKVMSSVDAIHLNPAFTELHRRLLVIRHKQFEKFTAEEKLGVEEGFSIATDRLEIDSIDWSGIEDEFFSFWSNPDHCRMYARYRTQLTRKGKKSFKVPETFTGEKWTISIDLICTGLLVGTWATIPQAIAEMGLYWQWFNVSCAVQSPATLKHLQNFIVNEVGKEIEINKIIAANGGEPKKLVISPHKLKQRLDFHQQKGELDILPKSGLIQDLMRQLGWRLDDTGWIEIE